MVDIAAAETHVWSALLETVDRSFSRRGAGLYARAVGCDPAAASGPRPLVETSTVPGFRVARVDRERELVLVLVLEGRHRFSTYALIFRVEAIGVDQARLTAESRAAFPGFAGRVYRLLVVGTGGHVAGVSGLLRAVRRRAEADARSPTRPTIRP